MSNSLPSNALVRSDQRDSTFTQQGNLDWVALGKMQYSASVAILARLAKAGIDTLTVAFGQAICQRLPIGVNGEKVLAEAMSKLTAKSVASDLLWFGVGVRHILRELVQTSQGCALVGLCAALTEGHSLEVSALILYEIAKECGGPNDLAPSLEQWEALVRVTASVFNGTTFGLRIHQFAKLTVSNNGPSGKFGKPPHPVDLARALLSIGQVAQGNLQSVSFQGGHCCSWIAAWADYILGLRIQVQDANGALVYVNFDTRRTFAQISIDFLVAGNDKGPICVKSSHTVRSGFAFISESFAPHRGGSTQKPDLFFGPGRLDWNSMMMDAFGDDFKCLITRTDCATKSPNCNTRSNLNNLPDPIDPNKEFIRMMAIAAITIVTQSIATMHYNSASSYILRACEIIPELRQCKGQLLLELANLSEVCRLHISLSDGRRLSHRSIALLLATHRSCRDRLSTVCGCLLHRKHGQPISDVSPTASFCVLAISRTVIYLVFLLDRVVFESPLTPTACGLYNHYSRIYASIPPSVDESSMDPWEADLALTKLFNYMTQCLEEVPTAAFAPLALLFSANDWNSIHDAIAQSDGKIYCYIQPIERLTDDVQTACQIHIGSGQIEYRTRQYPVLYDIPGSAKVGLIHTTPRTETVDNLRHLNRDSTSQPLKTQVLIEEKPGYLSICHQVTSSAGDILIRPSLFLQDLRRAVEYLLNVRQVLPEDTKGLSKLSDAQYLLAYGEGQTFKPDNCHILRPHRGNTLGRCITLYTSWGKRALVRSDEELELFLTFWRQERLARNKEISYYTLIS